MRVVVQRVLDARVLVDGDVIGSVGQGMLVLVGIGVDDTETDVDLMAKKVAGLRIFEDAEGKMNRSLADIDGGILAVSQFTLWGDCRKGRRPSFLGAARPEKAQPLFDRYVEVTRAEGIPCETGLFGADMRVELVNDGPVTLMLDSTMLV